MQTSHPSILDILVENCLRCGYISSNDLCKACALLEGLEQGLDKSAIVSLSLSRCSFRILITTGLPTSSENQPGRDSTDAFGPENDTFLQPRAVGEGGNRHMIGYCRRCILDKGLVDLHCSIYLMTIHPD